MTASARELVEEMTEYVAQLPQGEEKALAPVYADKIRQVGEVAFLAEVFKKLADADLSTWMLWLAFSWKDLSFESWQQVLREIAEDRIALYPFVWFAAEALALDAGRVLESDPQQTELARANFAQAFPSGVHPTADSPWWQEMLEEQRIDRQELLRRLASEGAPVKVG